MAFPKHHGILLAQNSWIENLQIERLAADPAGESLQTAGRFWFNTSEKVVKYTSLNPQGGVVVKVIADAASQAAALSALQASLEADIAAVDGRVTQEITDRTAAVAALQAALDAEVAAREAAITQEVADRNAAIAVAAQNAADATATETAARLAGDAAATSRMNDIQSELDAVEAGVGLGVGGEYVSPENSNFINGSLSVIDSINKIDAALKVEETTRIATDAALQSALNNEAQTRADADAALEQRITDYVNGQLTADATQDAAEVQARIDGDAAIKAELDQTQASIGLNPDGTFAAIAGSAYMDAATTVYGAAAALDLNLKRVDDALTAEVAQRTADVAALTSAVQTEVTNRTAADAAMQDELNATQAGAGLEADGSYAAPTGSNYLGGATTLKDATAKLDVALKTEADRAVAAESSLQGQIDSIVASSGEGAAALKSSINAGRFTFKSTVAAATHVVAHGLNSEFVQFTVMVEGEDGKFRNDIVPVEETDNNTLTIELSEVRNIKVVVSNGAQLV